MPKVRSNKYVYPYVPFRNLKRALEDGKGNAFSKKEISWKDLKVVLGGIEEQEILVSGKSVEEKIFSIFLDKNVLFGPKKYVESYREYWLEKSGYFTKKNRKIRFTLLGFPFKIPVPLKTNRKYPDMGEVLILKKLFGITDAIGKIYPPGAEIVVFTEGGLGRFVGVSKKEADGYKDFLIEINRKLGFSKSIKIADLSEMEMEKDYQRLFKMNVAGFREAFKKKDPAFMEKFKGANPSLVRIVNTRKHSESTLAEVYDEDVSDRKISKKGKEIREDILRKVEKALIGYFAYLKTRDDLDFLEKRVPHFLALSVSPKPKRLGVIPVNAWSDKLPYHSVPVLDWKKNRFFMEYLVDLKYGNDASEAFFLKGDREKKPFYYAS